jgi:cytochrome c-type biogenesis protein CcmH/NrfG
VRHRGMGYIAGGVLLFCAVACAQQPDEFLALKERLDQTPVRPKPGRLTAEMRQQIERHPGDPRYVYLYGRTLIGKDTPEALSQLKRAAAAVDPKLPWVY